MHSFPRVIRLLLASALTVALANPLGNIHGDISRREPPSPDLEQKEYYIKTRVHEGEDKSKDGLYVNAYHIGAGQNAAVLGKEPRLQAFFKNFSIRFNLSWEEWGFDMNEYYTYDGWVPVLINPSNPQTQVISFNSTLRWNDFLFRGWIVCDWALQEPQLFRLTDRYNLYDHVGHPSTCARVDLLVEDI